MNPYESMTMFGQITMEKKNNESPLIPTKKISIHWGIYLFYLGHFGFDFQSLWTMEPLLCAFFALELLVCCYGNVRPDEADAALEMIWGFKHGWYLTKHSTFLWEKASETRGWNGGIILNLQEMDMIYLCFGFLRTLSLGGSATYASSCISKILLQWLQKDLLQ